MATFLELFEEEKRDFEFGLNVLPNIPKAELNALMGLGLSVTAALYDVTISLGTLVGSALFYLHQKRQQDNTIQSFKCFKYGASQFGEKTTVEIPLENIMLQEAARGITHSFFRKPNNQLQDNVGVLNLACSLQIFRRNNTKDIPMTIKHNKPA